ncbi:MAG: hypothetical protein ACYDEA_02435 [Candidatus Dormibacteria bacterium]
MTGPVGLFAASTTVVGVALFMPWYSMKSSVPFMYPAANGWTSWGFLAVFGVITGVVALMSVEPDEATGPPRLPVSTATVFLIAAGMQLAGPVLFYVFNHHVYPFSNAGPTNGLLAFEPQFGIYVAILGGVVGLVAGVALRLRQQGPVPAADSDAGEAVGE